MTAADKLLGRFGTQGHGVPCTRLGLSAVDFKDLPSEGAGIKQFFTVAKNAKSQLSSQPTFHPTAKLKAQTKSLPKPHPRRQSASTQMKQKQQNRSIVDLCAAWKASPAMTQTKTKGSDSKFIAIDTSPTCGTGITEVVSQQHERVPQANVSRQAKYQCSRCKATLPTAEALVEHMDFHMASDLQVVHCIPVVIVPVPNRAIGWPYVASCGLVVVRLDKPCVSSLSLSLVLWFCVDWHVNVFWRFLNEQQESRATQ